MHTYRKRGVGWEVGYQYAEEPRFNPIGPKFHIECEAAAFASFMNGGRYSPGEIQPIWAVPVDEVDDSTYPRPQGMDDEPEDHTVHPDRPKAFDNDYPLERKRR